MRKYAKVHTDLPGPRSQAILARMTEHVPQALSPHVPAIAERGDGALLVDVDGNQFIDFAAGIGVLNAGHVPGPVVDALVAQARRLIHTDFTVIPYEPYVQLAEMLAARAPGKFTKKVAFFNSGAEAIENAVKIARYATGRPAVLALEGAFHGRTYMALSLTSKVHPYKERFGPFVPEVYRVPAPYCYRCPLGQRYPECGLACAAALERAFVTTVSPKATAALVVEPVLGEGGIIVPPPEYLPRVREITARHQILLIADEIQTGFGRTGRLFAVEHFGVEPDLMAVGKSIAAGLPLSGVVGRAELFDTLGDGVIGGTFVGNPVACAAGVATLQRIESDQLPQRAQHLGRQIRLRLEALQQHLPMVGDVRGLGAMMALELVKDRERRDPAPEATGRILRRCWQKGLICVRAGIYGNVIRILAPLVITDEQLQEGLDILEESIMEEARQATF